jgi:3-deoxy-D-manno-octulosonate 8-phosphate phosphatase (KDO 8-P phosphatase)
MFMKTFYEKLGKIRAMIFDCDGVLSDGKMLLLEDGEMLRNFHVRDAFALYQAVSKNYHVAVIAEEGSMAMEQRLKSLGIKNIYFRQKKEKLSITESFLLQVGVPATEAMYMGDDLPDMEAMKHAGLAVCPFDAVQEIRNIAHYVCRNRGGEGCVREIIEMIMKAREDWK